jgi:hypothetical protein
VNDRVEPVDQVDGFDRVVVRVLEGLEPFDRLIFAVNGCEEAADLANGNLSDAFDRHGVNSETRCWPVDHRPFPPDATWTPRVCRVARPIGRAWFIAANRERARF